MKIESERTPCQFRIIDLLALTVIVAVVAAGIRFSARYLPPISAAPPPLGEIREGQNWLAQGGGAYVIYSFLLLVVVYCMKRIILDRCTRRLAAVELFALLAALSLPYIWFLCEPDWSNSFIYRVSCWFGGPITIWLVPVVSFVVDLCSREGETIESLSNTLGHRDSDCFSGMGNLFRLFLVFRPKMGLALRRQTKTVKLSFRRRITERVKRRR